MPCFNAEMESGGARFDVCRWMGGFDACARLRALPGGAAMPVLIMTALNHAAVKRMLSIRE